MQVDLELFCADLRQTCIEKMIDASYLSPYLMDSLFTPYLSGEQIRLDSLDYDAFTLDDLDELMAFVEDAEEVEQKLEPVWKKLLGCDPAVRKFRSFC
jgi:hypothetical protein